MSDVESGGSNAPAFSVTELAQALKRTLEDAYGYVRVRAEVSKVTRHSSGHVYLTLKDDKAAIDGVIWKGVVRGLKAQPEQGLEVIVTGKITTFPASSKYQIVIDQMEAAGMGALLAQLERLKARLHGEGLFAPERKRPLPPTPAVIGVITSPTGAVIRDILHRIRDRWPCRVLVWPVVVQGDQAAAQVSAAVAGFNALPADGSGPVPRPDVLIVARGGGSVEDLWPFNDEALARTVAAGTIPLISAVGHETDTTLIDYVADRRAPTPTGAAEMATPVFSDLRAFVADLEQRRLRAGGRLIEQTRTRLLAVSRGLPRPEELLALASQRFDMAASRLGHGLARNVAVHDNRLARTAGRLNAGLLLRPADVRHQRLTDIAARLDRAILRRAQTAKDQARLPQLSERLERALARRFDTASERLARLAQLHRSVNPSLPMERGFALVRRADGSIVRSGQSLVAAEAVRLTFADGDRMAVIEGADSQPQKTAPRKAPTKTQAIPPEQTELF